MIPTQQSMELLEVMLINGHFLMTLLIVCCVPWKDLNEDGTLKRKADMFTNEPSKRRLL